MTGLKKFFKPIAKQFTKPFWSLVLVELYQSENLGWEDVVDQGNAENLQLKQVVVLVSSTVSRPKAPKVKQDFLESCTKSYSCIVA